MTAVVHAPRARRLDDVLFGPETPARLLVVQAGLVVLMGARIALWPFRDLTPQPAGLFRPVPFLWFLERMPPVGVIIAFQVAGVVATVAWLLAGRAKRLRVPTRRVGFAVVWCCLLVLTGLRASRGKIQHNDLLLVWGALPLVFAPADASYRDRRPTRRSGWPIRTAIVVVSLAYFLTGYWKLRNSGLDWVLSDNMRWVLYWGPSTAGRSPWPDLALFVANRPWLSELSAGAILAFELTFPVVALWARARWAYVAGAWVFHTGTYLVLGLDYFLYAAVVTVLLVDWPPLLDRLRAQPTATAPAGRSE